jgi:protein-tyrosine kinase
MNMLAMNITGAPPRPADVEQQTPLQKSFTLLRTQLLLQLLPKNTRLIGISSPGAGEGRSFVAYHLAEALAEAHPCILVDLHVERPDVSGMFGLDNSEGALEYLSGRRRLRDLLHRTNHSQLHVLPAGRASNSQTAAELLFSERLPRLFEELKAEPGEPIVLFDLPQALANENFLVLSKQLEGQILVVTEDRTSAHDLEETLRLSASVPLIGTILNKTEDLIS